MTRIFGTLYAPAYDLLYREKDYAREAELIDQLFRRYRTQPVRSVLDLGCGTGSHALHLAAGGRQVVGVDHSFEMLAIAMRKRRPFTADVGFLQADIRTVELTQQFDAAIMMFAVLSYQTDDQDVSRALSVARRHLQPDGLVLFDAWYGPAVLAQGLGNRRLVVQDSDSTWERTSSARLDSSQRCCYVEFQLRRLRQGVVIEEDSEEHVVRYFSRSEIKRLLREAGFRLIRLGAFPDFDREPDRTTWNVMAVATPA